MANFTSVMLNVLASTPPFRVKANQFGGRIRVFESIFVAPASGAAPAIADKIIWGKLPVRSRLLGYLGQLQFNAGTAACTINVGDNVSAARHLAATAINAAGTAIPTASSLAKVGAGDTVTGSATVTNLKQLGAFTVGDLITGSGIPTGTTILSISANTLVMSAVATLTASAVVITSTGAAFETSDDSATAANAFVSTTDDCTLISVVAGAQVANNQVIKLTMPFVTD
ncbi:MAG: hypothetical protein HYX63_01575 [Gammaproteobacteria bacterium]|nr:hypothetical protein [Gammaproteobacteria bacterium]